MGFVGLGLGVLEDTGFGEGGVLGFAGLGFGVLEAYYSIFTVISTESLPPSIIFIPSFFIVLASRLFSGRCSPSVGADDS